MATQILSVGSGAAASGDQAVTDTPLTVALKATGLIDQSAVVEIQIKDDAGAYWTIGALTSMTPSAVISGPGTYRLFRPVQAVGVGVFSA